MYGLLTKHKVKILTEQAWSIKDLLYGMKDQSMICVLAGQSPYPEWAR